MRHNLAIQNNVGLAFEKIDQIAVRRTFHGQLGARPDRDPGQAAVAGAVPMSGFLCHGAESGANARLSQGDGLCNEDGTTREGAMIKNKPTHFAS